jgi:beta-glucanase (GH16 family)
MEQIMKVLKSVNVLIAMILLAGTHVHAGWEVQWIDKFEGSGVNWDNWTAQIQANYNNEVQCYTDDDSSANRNYDVSNGTLKIIARKQTVSCAGLSGEQRSWTSGRLNGKDKSEMQYGRIEARIRFHDLQGGTWPAFWMLENRIAENPLKGDNDSVNWPNPGAGEIDVWEWFSNDPDSYITNFFNSSGCGGEYWPEYSGGASDVTAFHDYALEWDENNIRFFMDETQVASYNVASCPQYKEPMFVLLNVAIGGNLGGAIDSTMTTATMEVDYVAHCIPSDANVLTGCNESTPMTVDTDGDGIGDPIDDCPQTEFGVVVNHLGCAPENIPTEPNAAAPSPNAPLHSVISLFSDSYPNIASIDYDPFWGQATQMSEILIENNATLLYSGLNYQGTDFDANHQNVTAMKSVHLDFWTADGTALQFYLISPGPVETPVSLPVTQGEWVSVDIPLTEFTNVDLSNLFQLKIVGNGSVYLDNIYFTSAVDSDGDGVFDENDLCANTQSNASVDENGCIVVVADPVLDDDSALDLDVSKDLDEGTSSTNPKSGSVGLVLLSLLLLLGRRRYQNALSS